MRDPMITVEDFTALPEGCDVDEGTILSCPRCGRNGVFRHQTRSDVIVHVQTLQFFGDGIREEPRDCCTVLADDAQGDGQR